ncbi:MAG: PLP-dependent aminotransferase family protein, partial [Actinobacteria bacterium]|nr:PLP-dependent aminotransferase family protein [Actinomycetota bacterium]
MPILTNAEVTEGADVVKAVPMRPFSVVTMLHGWCHGSGALHERLAADLRRLIEMGELEPLTLLPSERSLARSLAVGRGTVVAAYDLLRSTGLICSKQGSGTWVAGERPRSGQVGRETALFPWLHRVEMPARSRSGNGEVVDLSAVVTAAAAPVVQEMAALDKSDLMALAAIQAYVPVGLPLLREEIARQFTDRGILTTADQIVVTTGAQQALDLVVSALLQRGEGVVLEDPTYPGALPILRGRGAHLIPVPLDEEGALFDRVEDAIIRLRPRLLYLNPTYHNPTGTVMPDSRRRQLVELASS